MAACAGSCGAWIGWCAVSEQGSRGLPSGRLPAKLVAYDFGRAGTGADQVGVLFEFTEPPWKGQQITWYGGFSEASFPITYKGLRELGWRGETLTTLREDLKPGTLFQLVCEVREFNNKHRSEVKFINRGGLVRMSEVMTGDERRSLDADVGEMIRRGAHEPRRADTGAPPSADDDGSDDIPF